MYKNILCIGVMIFVYLTAVAQYGKVNYSEENQLYRQVADITIITTEGSVKKISDQYTQSPLIIAFVYTRCAGICTPFLANLANDISVSGTESMQQFKILVISFDTSDRIEDMLKLASRYKLENNPNWIFATTGQIDILNKSVGFHPVMDTIRKQFDHEALLVGINNNGFIIKKLTGLRTPDDITMLIKELNGTFVASYQLPGNNSLFSCFTYDLSSGERKISFGLLLLIAPFIVSIVIIFIIALITRNRFRNELVSPVQN